MHAAPVTADGSCIRWVELPGAAAPGGGESAPPVRVYLHGLGASAAPYFAATAVNPLLAGLRSLLLDLLGFGLSDRPVDFAYTLEDHADAVAIALRAAGVRAADVVAHSMGGAVAIVLASRHPELVRRLVLVDANLDPLEPSLGRPGSSGIAVYSESDFLAYGWDETRDRVGAHWWSTMRLAGREALYRSAVHLAAGTTPTMRELLLGLPIPRTYLYPEADGAPDRADQLRAAGVRVVAVPDCGHNIMLDQPDLFARLTAEALEERLEAPRHAVG